MSTHALKSSERGAGLRLGRRLDLLVVALALPVFLAGGLPLPGWAAATGIYLAQRAISVLAARRARDARSPGAVAGFVVGAVLLRGYLIALGVFAVGYFVSDAAGLSAAVLFLWTFTVGTASRLALRPLEREGGAR